MSIFKGFALYLALAGIAIALILMKILSTPMPKAVPLNQPAENPYANALAASGIVEAVDKNISIGVPIPGLVQDVYVNVWDRVKADQPLFKLDDRELQAQLLVQEANIKVSEASLERLKDQLKRLQSVKDPRAVSQDEVKTRLNDVAVAEAQLAASYSQAKQTQLLIDRLTIRAPKDGIILQSNLRKGEFVTADNNAAMLLGNLDHLQVRADIDEQNASSLDPRMPATAFPKNNTKLSIPLYFDRIEPYVIPKRSLTGESSERVDTRVLQVIYSFDEPKDFNIYVGQQMDVFIQRAPLSIEQDSSSSQNPSAEIPAETKKDH